MEYKEQLKNPKWQKKRLEIFQRDNFTCQICLDTEETLQVHHKSYDKGKLAWEYGNDRLTTLCATCHEELTKHLKTGSNPDEFALIKIKNDSGHKIIFVYTCGFLVIKNNDSFFCINERISKLLVQFLINNWLKNG